MPSRLKQFGSYLGWISVVIGWLAALLRFFPTIPVLPGLLLFEVLGLLAFFVILHEIGHYIAAKLTGIGVWFFVIGEGSRVDQFAIGDVTVRLNAWPLSGFVRLAPAVKPDARWRLFFVVACGPLVNALCAILLFVSLLTGNHPGGEVPELVLLAGIVNLTLLISSLVPRDVLIDGIATASDGRLLLGSISHQLQSFLRRPTERSKIDSLNESIQWQRVQSGLDDADEYLSRIRDELQGCLSRTVRLYLLDQFITARIMYNCPRYLSEAERYSRELFEARGVELTVKGSRGSVLVESGNLDEGMKMLQEVIHHDPNKFDCGIAAAYLALGHLKKGEVAESKSWLERARHFDPDCVPAQHISKLLPPE